MDRRAFLRGLGFVSAGATLSQLNWMSAQASPSDDYKALVCVFLFGGNDGNNMIVPIDARYDAYAAMRGSIALPAAGLVKLEDANGSAHFGMHSGLSRLKGAWQNGHMAVLLNAGPLIRPITRTEYFAGIARPPELFSHSGQQRTLQLATRAADSKGWGGRIADEMRSVNAKAKTPASIAIAQGSTFSTAATGSLVLPTTGGLALRGSDSSTASRARAAALDQMLAADKNFELVSAAQDVTAGALRGRAVVNSIVNSTSNHVKTAFTGLTTTLSKQLASVAKLVEKHQELGVRRQVFFVGLGGFDTHAGQLTTQNTLLTQLGGAVKAFYDATAAMGMADKVTTFTLSDFARTMRANTAGGTDHAWGNHHLIVGGAVRGRTLYGQLPEFVAGGADDAGSEGRWIPTTSIDQYAATLARWFGVSEERLESVFPGLKNFANKDVGFV